MAVTIIIQHQALDIATCLQQALLSKHDFGAQVTFTGVVRQCDHAMPISHLYLQHYPQVTEAEIERIVAMAQQKWSLSEVMVLHRVGQIAVGEAIVWVLTQSKHRAAAYAANEYIMDYLKVAAPLWKKECFANGVETWVAAKSSDVAKQHTWNQP